ncbi:MAG TPA: hypothetical protein VFE55_15015 [Acidimicrobiia bacterium]|nr:hypothetical protein [Acidimicrobiia bacterium]
MLDYQSLGLVAVAMAVVTRGSLLPILAVTVLVGLVSMAGEAVARRWRRRHPAPARPAPAGHRRTAAGVTPNPSDGDFGRWMAAVERVLRSAE